MIFWGSLMRPSSALCAKSHLGLGWVEWGLILPIQAINRPRSYSTSLLGSLWYSVLKSYDEKIPLRNSTFIDPCRLDPSLQAPPPRPEGTQPRFFSSLQEHGAIGNNVLCTRACNKPQVLEHAVLSRGGRSRAVHRTVLRVRPYS